MSTHSTHSTNLVPISIVFSNALDQSAEPWLPDISNQLAATVWNEIACLGFTSRNYGSHRWLVKNPSSDCIRIARQNFNQSSGCQIEVLPAKSRSQYEKVGLIFSDCSSIIGKLQLIRSAFSLISSARSLNTTISNFLLALHILKAANAEYDISHSDPNLPFSIFVSIPPSNQEGRLRLAESIVHECMHLQLTAVERVIPLSHAPELQCYSPWQQTLRPVNGVLHGLYVFTVVYKFLGTLRESANLLENELTFISKRRRQILNEVAQVAYLASVDGLTNEGRRLVYFLNSCLDP